MAAECTCSVVTVDMTDRFTELVNRPEAAIPLDEAALVIAAHAHPGLDVEGRARLSTELDAEAAAGRPLGEPRAGLAEAMGAGHDQPVDAGCGGVGGCRDDVYPDC